MTQVKTRTYLFVRLARLSFGFNQSNISSEAKCNFRFVTKVTLGHCAIVWLRHQFNNLEHKEHKCMRLPFPRWCSKVIFACYLKMKHWVYYYNLAYSAFANSCPLQTDTFLFPLIHSHNVILSSNKF